MTTISLILIPDLGSKGFHVMLGERELCHSTWPFHDAACVLLDEGIPRDTILEATHDGQDFVAMRATIGAAIGTGKGSKQTKEWDGKNNS
jgi:hypothetical protein